MAVCGDVHAGEYHAICILDKAIEVWNCVLLWSDTWELAVAWVGVSLGVMGWRAARCMLPAPCCAPCPPHALPSCRTGAPPVQVPLDTALVQCHRSAPRVRLPGEVERQVDAALQGEGGRGA